MADMMTLALDPATYDLFFDENGMMACVYDSEVIAQNIRNNLLTWKGEFPLNTDHGTQWERVAGHPLSEAYDEADDVLRASIFQEPYVQTIDTLTPLLEGRRLGAEFTGTLYDSSTVRVEVMSDE